jgi:hypothetical protein
MPVPVPLGYDLVDLERYCFVECVGSLMTEVTVVVTPPTTSVVMTVLHSWQTGGTGLEDGGAGGAVTVTVSVT